MDNKAKLKHQYCVGIDLVESILSIINLDTIYKRDDNMFKNQEIGETPFYVNLCPANCFRYSLF